MFHNKSSYSYKVQPSTSMQVRRAAETQLAETQLASMCTESQKEDVALWQYLAHTSSVANQHYRMRQPHVVAATAAIMEAHTE